MEVRIAALVSAINLLRLHINSKLYWTGIIILHLAIATYWLFHYSFPLSQHPLYFSWWVCHKLHRANATVNKYSEKQDQNYHFLTLCVYADLHRPYYTNIIRNAKCYITHNVKLSGPINFGHPIQQNYLFCYPHICIPAHLHTHLSARSANFWLSGGHIDFQPSGGFRRPLESWGFHAWPHRPSEGPEHGPYMTRKQLHLWPDDNRWESYVGLEPMARLKHRSWIPR